MTCPQIKKGIAAGILLAAIFLTKTNAQQAEKIFHKDYTKISIVIQPAKLDAGTAKNNNGSSYPAMLLNNTFSYQFGFYYNFIQKGNFNFKTGLIAKEFRPTFNLKVTQEDIASIQNDASYLIDFEIANAFLFSVPLKAEYIFPVGRDFNFVAGLGASFNLSTGIDAPVVTSVAIVDDYQYITIFVASEEQQKINLSGEISLGLNYKSRFGLFQLEAFYSKNLSAKTIEGNYVFINLANTPDTKGSFKIDNDFYGLSLSITPPKSWFH